MSGLLSGLSELGLGNMENIDLYAEPAEKTVEEKKPEKPKIIKYQEKDFLFDKK